MRALWILLVLAGTASAGPKQKSKPKAKPWLGISINDTDAVWGGVAVLDVFDDTPAKLCGLRAGDEIVAVDGVDVHSTAELQGTVMARGVGDKVKVQYVRAGDVHRCKAKLSEVISDPTELLQRRLVGRTIPTFSLVDRADGTVVDDTSTRGEVVVLALFSTACDGCAETLADLASSLADSDAAASVPFYAVSGDGEHAVDAYVQRMAVTVDLAIDQGKLVQRYHSDRDAVTILVVDHEGTVEFAASGAGPDQTHLDSAAFCASRAERARKKAE